VPRRKLVAGLLLAAGSIAGALYVRQQLSENGSERVGLYFADGTLLELDSDEAVTVELLALARELLVSARPEGS
jgi:ferric-dicitrate binding protein FerR (iron transport regulator)